MKQNQPIPYPFPEDRIPFFGSGGQAEWQFLQTEVQRLHAAGEALNLPALQRHRPELLDRVFALFPCPGWRGLLEAAGLSYDVIQKEVRTEVACPLCDFKGDSLTGHLRHKHKIPPEEFHRRFPSADIASDVFRHRMRLKARKPLVPDWELITSPHYVVDRLLHYQHLGYRVNATVLNKLDRPMVSQIARWRWKMTELIRLTGLAEWQEERGETVPSEAPARADFDEALFQQKVQELAGKTGYVSLKSFRKKAPELARKAYVFYGNWLEALKAAGLGDDPRVRPHLDREKFVDEVLRELAEREGDAHYQKWREVSERYGLPHKLPLPDALARRAERLGLAPEKLTGFYSISTPEKALATLAGMLSSKEVGFCSETLARRRRPDLIQALEDTFGSLRAAWSHLPFAPAQEGIFWFPEDLRAFLQNRYGGGEVFAFSALRKGSLTERRIALVLTRFFGSRWRKVCRDWGLTLPERTPLPPRKKPTLPSAGDVIARLRILADQKVSLHGKDFKPSKLGPEDALLIRAIKKHFGQPSKALEAAGVAAGRRFAEAPHLPPALFFQTADDIIAEINWRAEQGLSLLRVRVANDKTNGGSLLVNRALKVFGQWSKALQAAGFSPNKRTAQAHSRVHRARLRQQEREEVFAQITRWREERKPLASALILPLLDRDNDLAAFWERARGHFGSWMEMLDTYTREVLLKGKATASPEPETTAGRPSATPSGNHPTRSPNPN